MSKRLFIPMLLSGFVLFQGCGSSNRASRSPDVDVTSPVYSDQEIEDWLGEQPHEWTNPETGEVVAFDEPPEAIQMVPAAYPKAAQEAEQEGEALVLVTVGATGLVLDVEVYQSSGSPLLDRAAMEAAKEWIFKPAGFKKKPVKVRIVIPFRFSLR